MALLAGTHAYIRVNNGVFVDDDCNEFTFSGYNTWQVMLWRGAFFNSSSARMNCAPLGVGAVLQPLTRNRLTLPWPMLFQT